MKPAIKTVPVTLSERSYNIYIGPDILTRLDLWLPKDCKNRKIFILTDENVASYYATRLESVLKQNCLEVSSLILAAGEQTKSFVSYQNCIEWLLSHGVNRQSLIIALGGGVIGDLAGFVAASVLRGIPFIQIPTTLLAQVDSSVGGKTGINSTQGKNLVGAFYQPISVVADTEILRTLPYREILAGYAEIIKYGLLGDIRFFEWLEQNGKSVCAVESEFISYAVETSCRMKAEIVRQDEREESGLRALLNLGHTFAHALETACKYDGRILHGEAVGIGLVLASRLSALTGYISKEDASRVQLHIENMGMMSEISSIVPAISTNADDLFNLMKKDKKATSEGIGFIILQKLGRAKIDKAISADLVKSIMESSLRG